MRAVLVAFGKQEHLGKVCMWRDFAAIVAANLASFIGGEVMIATAGLDCLAEPQ